MGGLSNMKQLESFNKYDAIKIIFLDFDGVFTDNKVFVDEQGREMVCCSRYDGFGIDYLKSLGIIVAVLTTETKPIASLRCEKLKINCFDSLQNKLDFAAEFVRDHSASLSECAFMGNDMNDLELLKRVLLPIVTIDCHPSVHDSSFYVTILPGGSGCIRELADHFLKNRN